MLAHEAVPARFDRYILTAGYNGVINQRQFQMPGFRWPTEYRYPDETYRDAPDVDVGGERFELHHGRGETDDHTWAWVPDRKVLCTRRPVHLGVAQRRQPAEGAALPARVGRRPARDGRARAPSCCCPGHGLPIVGADRIQQALADTADLLDYLRRRRRWR